MAGDAFERIKSTVNRGITTISVKTSSTLEKTKLKTHIDTLNKDLEKWLAHAGESAYRIWEAGGTDYSSLAQQFDVIRNKYAEIKQLAQELASIDERDNQILHEQSVPKFICPNCGAQYEMAVKFCRKCGTKLAD